MSESRWRNSLIFLTLWVASCWGKVALTRTYNDKNVLSRSDDMFIHWDVADSKIYIAMHAKTTGWLGFGIMEITSGSMAGSDMVIGWVEEDGSAAHVEDRYALEQAKPSLDDKQDWTLLGWNQTDSETWVEASRSLQTGDSMDRDILAGNTRVLFAFGDKDELTYHGANRFMTAAEFVTGDSPRFPVIPEPTEDDLANWDTTFNKTTIPSQRTWYGCVAGHVPASFGEDGVHGVKFTPIIDTGDSGKVIHHFVIYSCNNADGLKTAKLYEKATTCGVLSGCENILWAWAPGGEPLIAPLEAGFPFGGTKKPWATQAVIMNVHYDNVHHRDDLVDSSGVRITYTKKPRKHDAGTLTLGDLSLNLPSLPPKNPYIPFLTSCPSACTSEWDHSINVFADFLHMHQAGRRIWTTLHRVDGKFEEFNRIDYWDFRAQRESPIRHATINPGDTINLHCVFDTMKRKNYTDFGAGSHEEMCFDFLTYYPLLKTKTNKQYAYCGALHMRIQDTEYPTLCGGTFADASSFKTAPNPSIYDPPSCHTLAFGNPENPKAPVCENKLSTALLPREAIDFLEALADPDDACNVWQCQNGGTCHQMKDSAYTAFCECPDGVGGLHCENIDALTCTKVKCGNGECKTKWGYPYCACQDGHYGDKCQFTTKIQSECHSAKFGRCVLAASYDTPCAQYKQYQQCALSHNCPNLLKIMCEGGKLRSEMCYEELCHPPHKTHQPPKTPVVECNTTMYRQCYSKLAVAQLTNQPDQCQFFEEYLSCAKYSHCFDVSSYTCNRLRGGAVCGTNPLIKSMCEDMLSSTHTSLSGNEARVSEELLGIPKEYQSPKDASSFSLPMIVMAVVVGALVVAVVVAVVALRRESSEQAEYIEMQEM